MGVCITKDNDMVIGKYIDDYYNRMQIHVVRNGIIFIADIRDRKKWMEEMLKMNETAVLSDLGESHARSVLISNLQQAGYNNQVINDVIGRLLEGKSIGISSKNNLYFQMNNILGVNNIDPYDRSDNKGDINN